MARKINVARKVNVKKSCNKEYRLRPRQTAPRRRPRRRRRQAAAFRLSWRLGPGWRRSSD